MARCVFYSFHYKPDCSRAAQVRNMGVIEGNKPATDNDWEKITKGGEAAIQRWIDDQMTGKSCAVVLIGTGTAGRKYINYEIGQAWNNKKGLLGIYIHRLKTLDGYQATKGANPFDDFTMKNSSKKLSSVVKTYDPPYSDSKQVYQYISLNFATWVETAISIRNNYTAGS
jgi:hypothetical protein